MQAESQCVTEHAWQENRAMNIKEIYGTYRRQLTKTHVIQL